jgi:ketosteroid isomerase-like protein
MEDLDIEGIIKKFIESSNDFDVEAVLKLFAADALIDDVSVGEKFKNTKGVRKYLETFFVGYETVTKLENIEVLDNRNAQAQVDFTGNFGHETGGLKFAFNNDGKIVAISAYLD